MDPLPSDVFARRLRAERERLGMTQTDLARSIARLLGQNVDPSAINRIELRTRAVRLDEAAAMAAVLGVPLTVLVHESPVEELDRKISRAVAELEHERRILADSRSRVTTLEASLDLLEKERQMLYRPR